MNVKYSLTFAALLFAVGISSYPPSAQAGAEHYEYPFEVLDLNDCTGEVVLWSAIVEETLLINQTPSGRVVFISHWNFSGVVESTTSDDSWSIHNGVSHYVERFGVDGNLTGGMLLIERAQLRAESPGTSDIRLDVNARLSFNANGALVVDDVLYTYRCLD
jgi:hypothetical protein